jgi:hypothetical protein
MWIMSRFYFFFFENDVMLGVGLRKYEISRMVEQERNWVSVKDLFEMTN